jgi:hypothetical protein
MGYVIAGIIVLLIVAGFITYLVMNSMRKGSSVAADDGQPGIGGDETPLGDTTQHAGEQTAGGETAQDAERNAGVDPSAGPARPEDRQLGNAGAPTNAPQAPQPESERLADRPR